LIAIGRIEIVAGFIHGGVEVPVEDEEIDAEVVRDSELLLHRTLTVVLPPRERLAILERAVRQTLEMEVGKRTRPSVEVIGSNPGASLLR
jgi:hypothetical protein